MLTLIALSAVLLQEPPAPPPLPGPEVHSRFVFVGGGAEGAGGLDADGDGQVTRDEFAAPLNDAFGRMDKDGDGRLSREELASSGAPDGARVIVRRDGEPRRIELRRDGAEGGEARIVRDGERTMVFVGSDDEPESRVVVRTMPGREPGMVEFRGHGPRGARIELDGVGSRGGRELDKDGDGKVSEAEFTAPLREAFARMDADHSGFIEDGERGSGDGEVRVFTHRIETTDDE